MFYHNNISVIRSCVFQVQFNSENSWFSSIDRLDEEMSKINFYLDEGERRRKLMEKFLEILCFITTTSPQLDLLAFFRYGSTLRILDLFLLMKTSKTNFYLDDSKRRIRRRKLLEMFLKILCFITATFP